MSTCTPGEATATATWRALAQRAEALRADVRTAATAHNRDDLVTILDGIPDMSPERPARVIVAGSLKRGKSTLVNTLVGRPLLSPVGVEIKTACWLEIGYGEQDQAAVLLADARTPGQPARRPIHLAEIERYAALDAVTEPVLGVEVRIRSPFLRNLLLVDTPGVGGLNAGHSLITLTALGQADALLYVCDCSQPILAPEVDFLVSAAERVATVIVAVTKSDIPGYEIVVDETRSRLARRPELARMPLFAVSPPLAVRAAEAENPQRAERLAALSGVTPLISALQSKTASGRDALRIGNCALTTSSVARLLALRLDEQARDPLGTQGREMRLKTEEARLAALLADRSRQTALVASHLRRLRADPRDSFDVRLKGLRDQYLTEAQRGPSAQLATLAARMTADLTASCVAAIDLAASRGEELVRDILQAAGASVIASDFSAHQSAGIDLAISGPDITRKSMSDGLGIAGDLFPTVLKLIAGSAAVVSVLTGPGVIAASLAIAACAGWWVTRGGAEQDRRTALRGWVSSSADQASTTFNNELDRRVTAVEQFLDERLPALLDALAANLANVRRDLTEVRQATAEAQQMTQARLAVARDLLRAQADQADKVAHDATAIHGVGEQ